MYISPWLWFRYNPRQLSLAGNAVITVTDINPLNSEPPSNQLFSNNNLPEPRAACLARGLRFFGSFMPSALRRTATNTFARLSRGNIMRHRFVRHRLLILFLIVVLAAAALMPALVGAQTPTVDYDTDDDGLIEISNLAQLNAVRWDLNGDGAVSDDSATADVDEATEYAAAFPTPATGMGCPSAGCTGYELDADLDFDTNGSGDADSGDTYWDAGKGWTPLGTFSSGTGLTGTFDGNGHSISNLYGSTGLFGYVKAGGEVKDLGLLNADIDGTDNVGALADLNGADIAGVYVQGVVSPPPPPA